MPSASAPPQPLLLEPGSLTGGVNEDICFHSGSAVVLVAAMRSETINPHLLAADCSATFPPPTAICPGVGVAQVTMC